MADDGNAFTRTLMSYPDRSSLRFVRSVWDQAQRAGEAAEKMGKPIEVWGRLTAHLVCDDEEHAKRVEMAAVLLFDAFHRFCEKDDEPHPSKRVTRRANLVQMRMVHVQLEQPPPVP